MATSAGWVDRAGEPAVKLFDAILDFDAALDWPFEDDDLMDLAGPAPEPVPAEPIAS